MGRSKSGYRLGIRGEGVRTVDAGIVDQGRERRRLWAQATRLGRSKSTNRLHPSVTCSAQRQQPRRHGPHPKIDMPACNNRIFAAWHL
jgi:hypothetical protein